MHPARRKEAEKRGDVVTVVLLVIIIVVLGLVYACTKHTDKGPTDVRQQESVQSTNSVPKPKPSGGGSGLKALAQDDGLTRVKFNPVMNLENMKIGKETSR